MLGNRSFPVASYYKSPDLLRDGKIVEHGAAGIQCAYNSTQCARKFGPGIYVGAFRVNVEMASAR